MSVLDWAIRLCGKIEACLRHFKGEQEQEPTDSRYDTLAPKTINDGSMQEYFSALKYALSRNEVRNIAITGNYGAGKSTVVSSFMKYHCNDKFINVSLAGFDMAESTVTAAPTQQEIELSILQQILYKENKSSLPDSKIDRIQNKNFRHTLKAFLALLKMSIPAAAFFGILFFEEVSQFIGLPSEWSEFINDNYLFKISALAIFAFLTLYFITAFASKIGIFDKKIKLSKLAFLSGDMEVSENESLSLLNNCLDEIVYFFSRLKYKVVIFEDLDRLGTPEIFVKLREINKIINNNITDGKPVRFIYAVRDDLFSGSDAKTKFFDFILPVISFMDSRNAFTLLKNKMSFDLKHDKNLKYISAYIGDMRSLQNIVNEYYVFSKVVDNKKDQIRLLSVVFYKNIFTLDYNLTDKKTGVLYSFIREFRTRSLHSHHFQSMEEKIKKLNTELEFLDKEITNNPCEIRCDIITRFLPKILLNEINFYFKSGYNHSQFDSSKLIEDEEYFINMLSTDGLYIGYNGYYKHLDLSFRSEIKEEYLKRKITLKDSKTETYRYIHKSIQDIKEKIRARNAISLKNLIGLIGRNRFVNLVEHYLDEMNSHDYVTKKQLESLRSDMRNGGSDALYILLSNGLILQDYMSYRSIFHEGSMTANDNDFIKVVGLGLSFKDSNEQYFIDDEIKVIAELADQRLIYSEGALHHQLVAYLVNNHDSEYMAGIATSLFQKSDEKIIIALSILYSRFSIPDIFDGFIIKILESTGYLDRASIILAKYKEIEFSTDIAISIISGVSPNYALDKNKYLYFIHELGSRIISQVPEEKSHKFMNHVLMAGTSYEELFSPFTPTEIYCLQFIANHNLYQITKNNVGIVISCLLNGDGISAHDAEQKPWTYSFENNLEVLTNYFLDNIDIFIREVFVYSKEDVSCISYILTNTSSSDASKLDIIKKMNFLLSDLSDFESEILFNEGNDSLTYHDLFYRYDRIIPEWYSLFDYLRVNYNKNTLYQYITKHSDEFGDCPPKLYSDEHYDVLYANIICNEEFDEPIYKNIVSSIKVDMNKIDSKLSVINFHRLVDMEKLALDENSYEMISSLYLVTEYDVVNDFIKLFNQNKNEFMNDIEFYLRKGKDEAVFEFLISEVIKSSLFDLAEKESIVINMNGYFIDLEINNINIPKDVIINIISNSVDIRLKVKLFIKLISMGHRDKLNLAKMCASIDEKELKSVFTNLTKATFLAKNTDNILLILKCLEEANIIKNYTHRHDGKFEVMIKPGTDFDDD